MNSNLIELPSSGEVRRVSRGLIGSMKELYDKEADILHDAKELDHDYVKNFKLRNFRNIHRGFDRIMGEHRPQSQVSAWKERLAGKLMPGITTLGRLDARAQLRMIVRKEGGAEYDLGLVSVNVVTDAFVNFLVDAMQNLADISLFSWHASGTGATAESVTDTALVTEVETRVNGNQTEGASANIYHTEAQIAYTATRSIVEHGVFTANTAGTLLDRSVFASIGVDASTQILFKYELTCNAGG